MRVPLRSAATVILALATVTCSDTPLAGVRPAVGPGSGNLARVSLAPTFSRSAQFAAANAQAFGVRYDSVHVVLRGLPDTTVIVKDTTVSFSSSGSDSLTLDLSVPVTADGQSFDAGIGFTMDGVVQFYGHGTVRSHRPNEPAPNTAQIVVNYAGPGSNAARVVINPPSATLIAGESDTFTATVFDSAGTAITSPIAWSSPDAAIVTVGTAGSVTALSHRGTATVHAVTPNGVSGDASVSVVLPAASISVVSGDGQTGKVGATLANPMVVQVSAADSVGVAGVNVVFSPPSGGGVGAANVTTDANGRASTTLKLGSTVGSQGFVATAAGFSAGVLATATAGDPAAIAIVSGNSQADTIHSVLAPLSVRVTDQSNNPVAGASVSWARSSGTGSLASATSITGSDGVATNTYTLGSTVAAEGVTASVGSGTALSASFSFTVRSGIPQNIVIVSGNTQTGRIGSALANPFVVHVTDVGGNSVSGAGVTWTATNGTIAASTSTDASGQAPATLTLGTTIGAATATAAIANGSSVLFTATAGVGTAAKLQITTQPPTSATSGVALTRQPVVQVTDQYGNAVAGTVTIVATPSAGSATGNSVTANATSGVATFTNLAVTTASSSVTLAFAVQGTTTIAGVTSSSISIGQAGVSQLILSSTQTSFTKVAGGAVGNSPTLETADANSAAVGNTAVRFAVVLGTDTVAAQTLTSDASGMITTTGLTTPDVIGTYTIKASVVSAPSVTKSVTLVVTAAAADHLVVSSTAAVVGTVGASTLSLPSVTAEDVFNNIVNNATVYWQTGSYCAPGFSLGVSSTMSNSNGVAAAPALTVPGGPASCQVKTSISNLFPTSTATFTFDAVMAPSGADVWLGTSTDAAWATSSNWNNGTPTSLSSVFIQGAVSSPKLLVDGVAGSVTLETGTANVSLQNHALIVSGNVTSSTGGINNGTLEIEGTGATTISGTLPTTTIGNAPCGGSSYTLGAATTAAGTVTVNCTLTIGAYSLTTTSSGGLTVGGSGGKLVMTNSSGVIDIAGAATFGGASESGSLTNGTAKFSGGLTVNANGSTFDTYAPSSSHITDFTGSSTQHVSVCTTGCATASALNNVDFASSSHVYFDHNTTFNGTFTAGMSSEVDNASGTTLTVSGDVTTLSSSSLQNVEKMILTGGTRFPHIGSSSTTPATIVLQADLLLDQAAAVTGNLTVQAGLTVGSNTMTVAGNFTTSGSSGLLKETTSGGLVDVDGTSTFAGADETGSLTNGTFEARADFVQSSAVSASSYAPSSAHKTSLWSGGSQSITFADPVNSFFYDVDVKASNTATFTTPVLVNHNFSTSSTSGTATFSDTLKVVGDLSAATGTTLNFTSGARHRRIIVGGAVTGGTTTSLGGIDTLVVTGTTFPIYSNTSASHAPQLTELTGTVALVNSSPLTVAGGLRIGTSLDLAGHTLTVKDSVIVVGALKFITSNSTLTAQGLFRIDGSGSVTAQTGTLEVGGDFTENASATAFVPSSGFVTRFNGGSAQTVFFNHSPDDFSGSRFDIVDVTNASSNGVTFASNGHISGRLTVRANAVLKSGSGISIETRGTDTTFSQSKLVGVQELIVNSSIFPLFGGSNTPAKVTVKRSSGNVSIGNDATLTGDLDVQTLLAVNGNKLTLTTGSLTVEGTSGLLRVQTSLDSVVVGGNATFEGADMDVGGIAFAAGAFDFKGNVTVSGTNAFYVSSFTANTARFTGSSTQTISISGSGNSFANITVGNSSTTGAEFTTDATATGVFTLLGSGVATVDAGQRLSLSSATPAAVFHSGSKLHVAGTVSFGVNGTCQAHDGSNGGVTALLDGTGSFFGFLPSLGFLNTGGCDPANLQP